MKPLVLNNVVLEEVIVDFVQRVAVRHMDGYTVSEHQVRQLDAVNEDDLAVTRFRAAYSSNSDLGLTQPYISTRRFRWFAQRPGTSYARRPNLRGRNAHSSVLHGVVLYPWHPFGHTRAEP